MDTGDIKMDEHATFLNNPYVNCCFITTYAGILSSAIKKGVSWFTFVDPAIGAPISPIESAPSFGTSSSGYDSESGSVTTSGTSESYENSPDHRPIVRCHTRSSQKTRREQDRVAWEKEKQRNKERVAADESEYGVKKTPSKFYQLKPVDTNGVYYVGMANDNPAKNGLNEVPQLEEKPRTAGKRRSGNNRRRREPKPEPLPPRKKEEIIIDEDGFQLVTGKKAAKLPQQPIPKPIQPEADPIKKAKRAKKNKKKKAPGPTQAMILHEMKSAEDFELDSAMEETGDEDSEPEVEVPQKAKKPQRKRNRGHKKEKEDLVDFIPRILAEEAANENAFWTFLKCIGAWLYFLMVLAPQNLIYWSTDILTTPDIMDFEYLSSFESEEEWTSSFPGDDEAANMPIVCPEEQI